MTDGDDEGHAWNQYYATISVSFAYACVGTCFAWTSPTLPRLLEGSSVLLINEEEGSWIASTLAIGATIGPLLAAFLLNRLGRKLTLMLNAGLLMIGWIMIFQATSLYVLCAARFIAGIACGVMFLGLPMFVAEITQDSLRGALSCANELSIAFGSCLEYFVGPYVSYHHLIIINMSMPVIFLLTFIRVPDTPHYLTGKGKREEAAKAISWFRGNLPMDRAQKEIAIIESAMEQTQHGGLMDLFRVKGNVKGLYLTLVLFTLQQFSGINVIQLYSELLFIKSRTNIPPQFCTMGVGTFQLFASTCAPFISKRFGYRQPLIYTSLLLMVEHFFLGAYFYFDAKGADMSMYGWVPVTCLIVYILGFSGTYGPAPWGILGETFPANIKVAASSLVTAHCLLVTFILTKFFTNVSELLGIYWGFWIFSISMAISYVFVILFLPETKGMTLQEVQDEMNKSKSKNVQKP